MTVLHGGLYILAQFEFPSGIVQVSDRSDSYDVSATWTPLVLDWGEIVEVLDGGEDSLALTVSNVPNATTGVRFSANWDFDNPPEKAPVKLYLTLKDSSEGTVTAPELFFVGAISEVSQVTDTQVVLQIESVIRRLDRQIGDPITRTVWPYAPDASVDRVAPIVLGSVKGYTPPLVRERGSALLLSTILSTDNVPIIIDVDDNEEFKRGDGQGNLKINEEVFTYDMATVTTDDQIVLTARAQSTTTAATHSPGDQINERAAMAWVAAGHQMTSVDTVYGVTAARKLVALDSGDYTVDLGLNPDDPATITLTGEDGLEISAPGDAPTYRRVEMDDVPDTPKTLAELPAGFPTVGNPIPGNIPKDSILAAGGAGEFAPNTYAVMKAERRILPIQRATSFDQPAAGPDRAFLAVEHWGLQTFGPVTFLVEDVEEQQSFSLDGFGLLTVESPEDLGDLIESPLTCWLIVNGEIMKVDGFVPQFNAISVERALWGTTQEAHQAGSIVQLYAQTSDNVLNPGQPTELVTEPAIYFPQMHVLIENDDGDMESVGKLSNMGSVPIEIPEKAAGYSEAQTLTAWHGHKVSGLGTGGKLYQSFGQFDEDLLWRQAGSVGGLLVSTVQLDSTSPNIADDVLIPGSVELGAGYALGSDGLSFIMNPGTGLGFSYNQRIRKLVLRFAHARSGGSSNGRVRVRVWVGSNIGQGGSPQLVADVTKENEGTVSYGQTPKMSTVRIKFDVSTGFDNGIRFASLTSRHFTIMFTNDTGTNELYYVTADLKPESQQLVGGGAEFLGNRSIIETVPNFAITDGSSSYVNNGYSGPLGDGSGVNWATNKIVPELMKAQAWPYLLEDTSSGFDIKNPNGNKNFVLRFSNNGGTNRDLQRVKLYVNNIRAPSSANIYRVTLYLRVAGFGANIEPLQCFMRNESGTVQTGFSEDAGGWTNYDGNDVSARLFTYTFNLKAAPVSVKQFIQGYYLEVTVNGAHDITQNKEVYCDFAVCSFEVDDDRTNSADVTKAEQFTRVDYFDVSSYVSSYDDIQNRRIEIHKIPEGFDMPESVLDGLPVGSKDDDGRPVFVSRVWWTARYRDAKSEELREVAYDGEGISLTPAATAASAVEKVLTYGAPLMAAESTDIDLGSLVQATLDGALNVRGVVSERTTGKDLLQSLCEQSNCFGFWHLGKFTMLHRADPTALPVSSATFSDTAGEILFDSLSVVRRPVSSVSNELIVRGGPDHIKGGFTFDAPLQAPTSVGKYGPQREELSAQFLQSQTDVDSLASRALAYRKEPEVVVRFQTTIFEKARNLKRGDIVSVIHPLGTWNKLEVVAISKAMGTVKSGIPAYEIEAVERDATVDEAEL